MAVHRGHDLLQHVQPARVRQVQAQCVYQLAVCVAWMVSKPLQHLKTQVEVKIGKTAARPLYFTLQQSECSGACADSPVMLVNDRHMCSFMSNDKLDQLIDGLRAAEGKA